MARVFLFMRIVMTHRTHVGEKSYRTGGFTILELVFVILIGSLLTALMMQAFSGPQQTLAARGARSTFATYHARTRAAAIESGAPTLLLVDAPGDSLLLFSGGSFIEGINVRNEYGANIVMDSTRLSICMGPRGYTMSVCNSFTTTQTIRFVVGTDTAAVDVLPLGQLIY